MFLRHLAVQWACTVIAARAALDAFAFGGGNVRFEELERGLRALDGRLALGRFRLNRRLSGGRLRDCAGFGGEDFLRRLGRRLGLFRGAAGRRRLLSGRPLARRGGLLR